MLRYCLLFILVFTASAVIGQKVTPLITDTNYVYKSVSVALENVDKAYKLDLSKHKMKSIPDDVFKLTHLRELNMSHNYIKTIPPEISRLTELQRLNLASNDIDSLPDEIGSLTKLIYLGLNRNDIVELPEAIGSLESLEVLELWDNEISVIPDEFSKLKKLQTVELRGILFSDEEQARIRALVPNATIYFSPSCQCKF
jgi:Leucine-rich repeat (LRR) protein